MTSTQTSTVPDRKTRHYAGVNLFVKNLDSMFDDQLLNALFSKYGRIISCKVQRDENGASKGFGFVCYTELSEASTAIAELNGKVIGSKPLYVNLFESKAERAKNRLQKAVERTPCATGKSTPEEFLKLSEAASGRGRGRGRSLQLLMADDSTKTPNSPFAPRGSATSQATRFAFSPPGRATLPGSPEQLDTELTSFSSPRSQTSRDTSGPVMSADWFPGTAAALPSERPVDGLGFTAPTAAAFHQKLESPTNANTPRYAHVQFSSPIGYEACSPDYRSVRSPNGSAN